MATDGQETENLGVESSVPTHPEDQNENSHFVVPIWTESLQNNGQFPPVVNESQNINSQFSSAPNNQTHFQHDFTQIRPQFDRTLTTSCHVNPISYNEVLNIQHGGTAALNVQDGSVFSEIPGVQDGSITGASFPGILATPSSVSESPNLVTYGYAKIIPANSQEQIPLSYTELLSSVQSSSQDAKVMPQDTTPPVFTNPDTETVNSSQNLGNSQFSENSKNDNVLITTDLLKSFLGNKDGKDVAGIVPESLKVTESNNGSSINLVGSTESKNNRITTQLEDIPAEEQSIIKDQETSVPVNLIQEDPERAEKPDHNKTTKTRKRKVLENKNQTPKSAKRKLRQNKNSEVSETNRLSSLRSGKKTGSKIFKRGRKKGLEDTPVEYEIVKHEKNLLSDESIETDAYNDLLAELNSMKDEYIKLQNSLTTVEDKYNALVSNSDKNKLVKKDEDPELLSSKLLTAVASFFNKPLFSDIQVLLGEGHVLYGHKLILSVRSEYWGLEHLYYIDKLDLTGVRQEIGYEVMKWVYTDELDTKVDVSFILEILHASVKYKLDGLYKRCEKGLISLININNCENLKEVAEDLNCTELQEECQQFLDVHQITPVSPLVEDNPDDVLDDLDNEDDSDFEPNVIFEEEKKDKKSGKKGMKSLRGLKDKKRMTIRNKKKISSIVEKLHKKKLSEAVDEELGSKLSNKLERLQLKARILAGEKPYQCDQCGRAFAAKGNLKRHISMHSDDKPFECGICRKGFKTNSEVKRHNIVHSGEKRFMCDICSMCFSAGSSLHRHMRIHRGEKPYQCEACGKSFRSSGDVTKHNLTHTGEKPYKCPVCGKTFSRTQHVKKHMGIHKRQLGLQFHENHYPDYVKVKQNE